MLIAKNKFINLDFFYILLNILILSLTILNSKANKTFQDVLIISNAFINLIFFLYKIEKVNILNFFLVFFSLSLALIGTIINDSGLGAFLTFFNICMYFLLFNCINIKEKEKSKINIILICFLIALIVSSNISHILITSKIGLPYSFNPNTLGFFIFILLAYLIIFIFKSKIKIKFLLTLIILGSGLYIISRTHARTSLIGGIFLVPLTFFIYIKKNNIKFYKSLLYIVLLSTIIIPVLYSYVMYPLYGDLVVLGKRLFTGRQDIYIEIFSLLNKKWFLGYGSKIMYLNKFSSAHNSFLGFWGTLGLLPFITIIWLIVSTYKNIDDTKKNVIIKYILLIIIFLSTFETILNDPITNTICFILISLCDRNLQYQGKILKDA